MPRLDYKKPLHGQINWGKGGWNGRGHAWIWAMTLEVENSRQNKVC